MPTWSEEFGGPLRKDQIRAVAAFIVNFEPWAEDASLVPTPIVAEVIRFLPGKSDPTSLPFLLPVRHHPIAIGLIDFTQAVGVDSPWIVELTKHFQLAQHD